MALPLLALAVALVLVLLAAVLAVLVKLVIWLSISKTLLAVTALTLYWFVASRRRRYARGFYSCSQVPPPAVTTPATTTTKTAAVDAAGEVPVAVTTASDAAAFVRRPAIESQWSSSADASSIPTMTSDAPVADADRDADARTASDDAGSGAAHGVKVIPVRRRSIQLPGPLTMKLKGDASSPSLSATESEDDDDEPALTCSFASSRSTTSPMRAASVSPAPAARKVRPRSSSSSSGFSAANRKRLLGSPVRPPQNPHMHSSTSLTVRPHSNAMTPVRTRRSATIATNNTNSSSFSGTPHNKRSAFARRSAASERELMQEKMAADGYWIGDFRLERQLVTRRSFLSTTNRNGDRSGNNSARSSPRAV